MSKLNLTSDECYTSIREYISELDDMTYAMDTLQWEMEPVKLHLLKQANEKLTEGMEILKQVLLAPEKTVIEY